MRLCFLRQSKGKSPEVAALVTGYLQRMRPFAAVECFEPKSRGTDGRYQPPSVWNESSTRRIVLDERGKSLSSLQLAGKLEAFKNDPAVRTVAFFVGAPFGVPPEILQSAHEKWSLSHATLPSDLAWLVLAEQVYRGLSILAGTPYHHE